MAIEVERLIAILEAKMDKFEKSLAKASGTADKQFKKVEDRGRKMEANLARLGVNSFRGFAASALSSLGPILSVAAAVNGAKDALAEFGDIADNAKASGLNAEFFQGLAYQAQLGGVAFDQLSSALATFSKNSGLAVVGKGKMVASLKELNPALLENIRAATSQEERIKLVAEALSKESDASTKAAIATAAFGDAGAKLADVFSGGAAQIDAMQKKAQSLGLVVANDLIARADELGDEFDTTTKIVDLQLKTALVNLGPILVWLTGLAGNVGEALGGLFEKTKSVADRSLESLTDQLKELRTIQEKALAIPGGISESRMQNGGAEMLRQLEQEIFRRGEAGSVKQLNAITPPVTGDIPTLDEITSRDQAAAATIKQAEAVQQLVADLQFEQSLIGQSAEDQHVLNTLRQAGVDATSKQGIAIAGLVQGIDAQKSAQDRLNQSMQENQQIAEQAGAALASALADGKLEAQELLGVLADVGKQLLLNAIANAVPGGSLITSFLGGLFGGGRASGGSVEAGKGYIVGEKGPEPFFPKVDGTILPNKSLSGAGGQIEVVVSLRDEMLDVRIDNRAANVSARVTSGGISTYDQALPGRNAEKQARYG